MLAKHIRNHSRIQRKLPTKGKGISLLILFVGILTPFFLGMHSHSQLSALPPIPIGGRTVDPVNGGGIPHVQIQVRDTTSGKVVIVATNRNGIWANTTLVRLHDVYSVRPLIYYGQTSCPKGYLCGQKIYSPNPWSYEGQYAGMGDCDLQCNFTFASLTPTPLPK